MSETYCGAPPNEDTHLPPCEKPAGHPGLHGAVGYVWGEHPTAGMLLPMPEAWVAVERGSHARKISWAHSYFVTSTSCAALALIYALFWSDDVRPVWRTHLALALAWATLGAWSAWRDRRLP